MCAFKATELAALVAFFARRQAERIARCSFARGAVFPFRDRNLHAGITLVEIVQALHNPHSEGAAARGAKR